MEVKTSHGNRSPAETGPNLLNFSKAQVLASEKGQVFSLHKSSIPPIVMAQTTKAQSRLRQRKLGDPIKPRSVLSNYQKEILPLSNEFLLSQRATMVESFTFDLPQPPKHDGYQNTDIFHFSGGPTTELISPSAN